MTTTTRPGLALGLGALGAAAVSAIVLINTASADAEPVQPTCIEPIEVIDRNCWDPTQHDLPKPAPVDPFVVLPPPNGTPHADLRSNRGDGLPVGTLQVVTFYDGRSTSGPTLRVETTAPGRGTSWLEITGIPASTSDAGRIGTYEFDLDGARPTGTFEISGIEPNGVIDGLAFGLFWRDAEGFHVVRSTSPTPRSRSTFVGAWPIGLSTRQFTARTPQLTTGAARQQARIAIFGAEYLDNGTYLVAIRERAVRTTPRDRH